MRTTNPIWSSLLLLPIVSGVTASAYATTPGEQAVAAAERQWLKAPQTNNMDLLGPLLADKVVYTSSDKLFDGKDAVIAAFKSYKYSSADYKDLRVRVFGRAAIATGLFVGKLAGATGKATDLRLRFTDTWMRMANDKWVCVASQD